MKKFKGIAFILAFTMLAASFAGCGESQSSTEETTAAASQTQQSDAQTSQVQSSADTNTASGAKVGDIVDKAEKEVSVTQFYAEMTTADSSGTINTVIAVKDDVNAGSGELYLKYGDKGEMVAVSNSDDSVDCYVKNTGDSSYKKREDSSSTDRENLTKMLNLTGYNGVDSMIKALNNNDYQLKKADDQNHPATGDAFVYDVIQDSKTAGQIWVDKATGFIVKALDGESGDTLFEITKLSTTDVTIPSYK